MQMVQRTEQPRRRTPVAAVIVNYNACEHLRRCLASLRIEQPDELVVVDNGSTDGSLAMLQAEYPTARTIANKVSPGYGAASNQGVALCRSPYILLLNSDTLLPGDAIDTLSAYLDERPTVGLAGPRLANPDGSLQTSTFPYPEPLQMLIRESSLLELIRALPVVRDRYLLTWAHDAERVVPWVLGAALLLRREAFEAVGGFDDGFYIYSDEVDLCYRLTQAGWEIRFTPTAEIVHIGGASLRQQRNDMLVQLYRSRLRFYRQHYSAGKLRRFKLILTYFMLRNLVRDLVRLRSASGDQHARVQNDILVWKRILAWLAAHAPAEPRRQFNS